MRWLLTAACIVCVSSVVGTAVAEDSAADLRNQNGQLQEQLKALTTRLDELEKRQPAPEESLQQRIAALEQKLGDEKSKPVAGWDGKFFIESPKGDFRMNFSAYTQFDGRFPSNGPSRSSDAFLFRRIRPSIDGRIAENYEYKLQMDFAGNKATVYDAFLNLHYVDEAQVKIGNFKTPFSLEQLVSSTSLRLIERSPLNALVPKYRLGVMVWGNPALSEGNSGVLDYSLGLFNGRQPGSFMPAGRLALDLSKAQNLGLLHCFTVGVNAALDHDAGATVAGDTIKTDLQTTFFDYAAGTVSSGDHTLAGADLGFWRGPFGFMAEYVTSRQELANGAASDTVTNDAWYAQASYVLTGEQATIKGVKPKNDFNPGKGTWGALEIAGRYAVLKVDDTAFSSGFAKAGSARSADITTVGVNWYLNKHIELMLDYVHSEFGAPLGSGADSEDGAISRLQLSF